MNTEPIAVQNFSHVCIGVSDIDASLAFYTAVLGRDVVFDVELDGAGLDAVTGGAAKKGLADRSDLQATRESAQRHVGASEQAGNDLVGRGVDSVAMRKCYVRTA